MSRVFGSNLLVMAGTLAVASALVVWSAPESQSGSASPVAGDAGRLFYLDWSGRVLSAKPDGSDRTVLLEEHARGPDGIVIDSAGQRIFWTNMGKAKENDGSLMRLDLDGKNLTTVVAEGGTFTPKQLYLDAKNEKLYWSDREGMRVMRSNLDGSQIETLVETARGDDARLDATNWCVGIAVDPEGGKISWTQKGGSNAGTGSIRRAKIDRPKGEVPSTRSDIEVLFDGLPEPIDLDLDLGRREMYWTDRGDPPRGNSVNRAPMDPPEGSDPRHRSDQKVLVDGLQEGIGIALDLTGGRMFFTDLGGSLYSAKLDGSDKRVLLEGQGYLTGVAYAQLSR